MTDRRPTIAELERILQQPSGDPITIMPNGEIRVFDREASRMAVIALDTAALGYAATVQGAAKDPESQHDEYCGAVEHLQHAALNYAASRGNLDAAERTELLALRRFREGIAALREELVKGEADAAPIIDAAAHAVTTIDAFNTATAFLPRVSTEGIVPTK